MLTSISWVEYIIFVFVCTVTWYIYVLIVYYGHELFQKTKIRQLSPANTLHFTTDLQQPDALIPDPNSQAKPDQSTIESFIDEIKAYLSQAGQNKDLKETVLENLTSITKKYPSLVKSAFRNAISQFIISQAESDCAVFISEAEASGMWDRT